tara:strand:+ start:2326 stop:2601 length:276 start_codon:yes stop_codon:yes gene_type:complete
LTGQGENKRKEDLLLERGLKMRRNVLTYLKHRLKEKESTAYLERSRHDIEMLKDQIESIQDEIDVLSHRIHSWKKWARKPEFSDDTKEDFK